MWVTGNLLPWGSSWHVTEVRSLRFSVPWCRALGKSPSLSPAASFWGKGAGGQMISGSCPSSKIMCYMYACDLIPRLSRGLQTWFISSDALYNSRASKVMGSAVHCWPCIRVTETTNQICHHHRGRPCFSFFLSFFKSNNFYSGSQSVIRRWWFDMILFVILPKVYGIKKNKLTKGQILSDSTYRSSLEESDL